MQKRTLWVMLIVLAFFPAVAYANAGTPLMWASALHLLFGNAIIGVGEGLILAFLFRQSAMRCVAIMVVANYFSAWVGGAFLIAKISQFLSLDLYNAWWWLWCMVAVTYVITLFLEWPFVALCVRKTEGWFLKSIWGSLAAQSASYLVLFGWYWSASGTTLYTDMTIVHPAEFPLPTNVMLYYIAENDGDVYAWNLDSNEPKKVRALGSHSWNDRLWARDSGAGTSQWDLMARLETEDSQSPKVETVLSKLLSTTVSSKNDQRDPPNESWSNFGEVQQLGAAERSDWKFRTGFWPLEGLNGENTKDGRRSHFSLETPFVAWVVRNAIQIPGDQVIFQLGKSQICIFDPNKKKIAVLVKGRGPVVGMDDNLKQVLPLPSH